MKKEQYKNEDQYVRGTGPMPTKVIEHMLDLEAKWQAHLADC